MDHYGVSLVYCFGTCEYRYFDGFCCLLVPFGICIVCCDGDVVYMACIVESVVVSGMRNAQCVERKRLSLRTWCSRLVRKGICFSKSEIMHHTVVSLIINFWFFKRKLPTHLF